MNNLENKNELETNVTTKNIPKKSKGNGCKDTKWVRTCPKCDKEITYGSNNTFKKGIRLNRFCKKCGYVKRILPHKLINPINIRKCPSCNKELHYKSRGTFNRAKREGVTCKNCKISYATKKLKKLLRKCPSCQKNLYYSNQSNLNYANKKNRTCLDCRSFYTDPLYKENQRIGMVKYCQNKFGSQMKPNYNILSCNLWNQIEKTFGWNGFYATKNHEFYIKELGYWPDYYEPNLNIIIEYDERNHYSKGNLKESDVCRQQKIENHLKCKFFRVKEGEEDLIWKKLVEIIQ
jgi:endogenous inhibitor of DNA gyrase (YacG/DUF329 family)